MAIWTTDASNSVRIWATTTCLCPTNAVPLPALVSHAAFPPPLPRADPLELVLAELSLAFAGDFFNGIVPETRSHHQRRIFKWPIAEVTTEDRLLVVIRAICKAGFPTIGSFLAALFITGD
ncbi:hypothetical protein B0H10DRAFT_2227004 [Mycena sp. CBHHK59/15]|nr:hypothetical protein B0H10DRAFT_2227004 [Mycena sp. CBHHK59/15]